MLLARLSPFSLGALSASRQPQAPLWLVFLVRVVVVVVAGCRKSQLVVSALCGFAAIWGKQVPRQARSRRFDFYGLDARKSPLKDLGNQLLSDQASAAQAGVQVAPNSAQSFMVHSVRIARPKRAFAFF